MKRKKFWAIFLAAIMMIGLTPTMMWAEENEIVHQPTAGEPYMELKNETDVTYQWYSVNVVKDYITDADISTPMGASMSATIENCWVAYSGNLFGIALNAGDVVVFDIVEGDAGKIILHEMYGPGKKEITTTGTGTYTIEVDSDTNYRIEATMDISVKIYKRSLELGAAIGSETASVLSQKELGEFYCCKATTATGVLTSEFFEYKVAISHQPTGIEPYVGFNENTEASYQWYSYFNGDWKITESDVEEIGLYGSTGVTYDETQGWSSTTGGGGMFSIKLEQGQVLKIVPDGNVQNITITIPYTSTENYAQVQGDGTYTITVGETNTYDFNIMGMGSDVHVQIYLVGEHLEAVAGQTSATFTSANTGDHICVVTYPNGTIEQSQVFCAHAWSDSSCTHCGVTCTHAWSDGSCTYCGVICTHSWGEYVSNQDATCKADGTKSAECDICDKKDTIADNGSKLAHVDANTDGKCDTCLEAMSTGGGTNVDSLPNTGDNTQTLLWVMLMILGTCMVFVGLKRRIRL